MNDKKNYDELMFEIQDNTKKLSSNEISMEDAMLIFEDSIRKIKLAKESLTEFKGRINKVLEDGELEEFKD